jgi:hypothetical protein
VRLLPYTFILPAPHKIILKRIPLEGWMRFICLRRQEMREKSLVQASFDWELIVSNRSSQVHPLSYCGHCSYFCCAQYITAD